MLSKYDLKAESSFIPMLYNLEKSPNKIHIGNKNIIIKNRVENIASEIAKSDFSIFCHSRHIWCNDENLNEEDWKKINKNSDWIVRGFSNFLHNSLIKFEYGAGIESL